MSPAFYAGIVIGTVWGVTTNHFVLPRLPAARSRLAAGILLSLSADLLAIVLVQIAWGVSK